MKTYLIVLVTRDNFGVIVPGVKTLAGAMSDEKLAYTRAEEFNRTLGYSARVSSQSGIVIGIHDVIDTPAGALTSDGIMMYEVFTARELRNMKF